MCGHRRIVGWEVRAEAQGWVELLKQGSHRVETEWTIRGGHGSSGDWLSWAEVPGTVRSPLSVPRCTNWWPEEWLAELHSVRCLLFWGSRWGCSTFPRSRASFSSYTHVIPINSDDFFRVLLLEVSDQSAPRDTPGQMVLFISCSTWSQMLIVKWGHLVPGIPAKEVLCICHGVSWTGHRLI